MTDFTQMFSEAVEVLAHVPADSETTVIDTGNKLVENFHRVVALISVGDMASGATLNIDLEQASSTAAGTRKAITGKSTTELTQAGGDGNQVLIIELRTEELDITNGFKYVNLEITPATAAVEFAAFLLGITPRYKPVSTTTVEEVVS